MISLPLPSETEQFIAQLSEREKKTLSIFIQAFVKQFKPTAFPDISLPGPSLTPEEIEKLAVAMEADDDFLNESESIEFLSQLKSGWSKSNL
jgi:hypothetical protein